MNIAKLYKILDDKERLELKIIMYREDKLIPVKHFLDMQMSKRLHSCLLAYFNDKNIHFTEEINPDDFAKCRSVGPFTLKEFMLLYSF